MLASTTPMRLKELTFNGRPSWPPKWHSDSESAMPVGEIGNLVRASTVKLQNDSDLCLRILVEHEGKRFFGHLRADDSQVLERVRELLFRRTGRPLAGMGDLEIGD